MAKKNVNPVIIRPDTSIGNSSAESDDEFLFDCFVDHPALASMIDVSSAKMFILGRTGSGKTAIIRMIEKAQPKTSIIDLHEMALDYVSNSDIIRFLNAVDVDLDLFFQALWKHVLCIELIRLKYDVDSEIRSNSVFSSFLDFFVGNDRKKSALDYLQKWQNKFWITMDENIREITQNFEQKVDAELGFEVSEFVAKAGYARTMSAEKKSQLMARAKKIIDSNQLSQLNKVLELLKEFSDKKKYSPVNYILIDRIDEKWSDDSIRYKLIKALIECLKSFRKVQDSKVIVAIRSDVIERVIQESSDDGFQREKYDDYFLRMVWRRDQLKKMVDNRINYLYRRKYTSDNVFLLIFLELKSAEKMLLIIY